MKIKAQIAMVMNLDKCIGCHTCSITCKSSWTNRRGTEYMYFNNVETKPGIGYPKHWENQELYKGGWTAQDGKLALRSGSRVERLLKIFYNPDQPTVDDYFEPWTYDYETLIHSGRKNHQPIARPRSVLTQKRMEIKWGPNWDDDLAGGSELAVQDYDLNQLGEKIAFDYHSVFMKYLPRTCNHCLNPACVAACPSGAIYKRDEDGIVLISQDICRGWRHCISACPYKKIYYNWETNKAEKCTFCFPRIENGLPMICADTCVGRLRYAGVLLYDLDKVEAAAVADKTQLYEKTLDVLLDPNDPAVQAAARRDGVPEKWLTAAQKSPVYQFVKKWQVALPLHAEYRTLPMVWYVPPMSPIINNFAATVTLPEPNQMRIPLAYLAELFAAGNTDVIYKVVERLLAMRHYMREKDLGQKPESKSDMTTVEIEKMYRLMALAKYRERFVIPAGVEKSRADLFRQQGSCGYPCERSEEL